MTRKSLRTRTRKRHSKRLPGGASRVFATRKKPNKAKCALTSEILHSTPRTKGIKDKTIPKSQKRPERPYGGILGSRSMRNIFIQKARKND